MIKFIIILFLITSCISANNTDSFFKLIASIQSNKKDVTTFGQTLNMVNSTVSKFNSIFNQSISNFSNLTQIKSNGSNKITTSFCFYIILLIILNFILF